MSYRPALHVDDALKPIRTLRCGGKPIDPSGIHALHDEFKVWCCTIMALVANDEIVVSNYRLSARDAQVVLV